MEFLQGVVFILLLETLALRIATKWLQKKISTIR
jgi:hypothetical protein